MFLSQSLYLEMLFLIFFHPMNLLLFFFSIFCLFVCFFVFSLWVPQSKTHPQENVKGSTQLESYPSMSQNILVNVVSMEKKDRQAWLVWDFHSPQNLLTS